MRILIAEDDPVTRRLLQVTLERWQFEVTAVADGVAAWEALTRDDAPSLAILDWIIPGIDGPEICRKLRGEKRNRYTYIVLLTSKSRPEEILEGLDAGADSYILKPFDPMDLRMRLQSGCRIAGIEDELLAAHDSLREQAARDPLTGLWNRRAILDILEREIFRAAREGNSLSLIMADIDHFKQVNDRFGHLAGDAVLRETARRMQSVLRPYDSVGRYGGEEFSIIVPCCEKSAASSVAARVGHAISSAPVLTPDGHISVTVSLGVTTVRGTKSDPDFLLRSADAALYRAKQGGRNRVEQAHT
jgi:two-component system, cell cycle response regulator